MMRNYRELSTEEVEQLCTLYPVTTNRELSRMFDVSVDAIIDRFAVPNGWKKDRKTVLIGNRGGVSLTDEQIAWIVKHYKHTKNADILRKFGIGESTLHRLARKHGLTKSKQFCRKVSRENAEAGYAICRKYGIYDELPELQRQRTAERIANGTFYGFKKGESNKTRFSQNRYRQIVEQSAQTRRETIRKERIRIRWGLEQKTKLKLVHNRERSVYRHLLKKKGYIVQRAENIVFYDDLTKRSERMEAKASTLGLKVSKA